MTVLIIFGYSSAFFVLQISYSPLTSLWLLRYAVLWSELLKMRSVQWDWKCLALNY